MFGFALGLVLELGFIVDPELPAGPAPVVVRLSPSVLNSACCCNWSFVIDRRSWSELVLFAPLLGRHDLEDRHRQRDVLGSDAEESAHADHQGVDLAALVDEDVADVADLLVVGPITSVPISFDPSHWLGDCCEITCAFASPRWAPLIAALPWLGLPDVWARAADSIRPLTAAAAMRVRIISNAS